MIHGVTAWREKRCDCALCAEAGAEYRARRRAAAAAKRSSDREKLAGADADAAGPSPELELSVIDRLSPGSGVRRRDPVSCCADGEDCAPVTELRVWEVNVLVGKPPETVNAISMSIKKNGTLVFLDSAGDIVRAYSKDGWSVVSAVDA